MSSDLLFAAEPDLTMPGTEKDRKPASQVRLEEYLENGLMVSIREAAEVQAALGGVYLRAVWDRTVYDRPWIQPVHPDLAIPEWSFDKLRAVTYWRVVLENSSGEVWRHLERHEPGVIFHGLYKGTKAELGTVIPLNDHPETEIFVSSLTRDDYIETGIEELTSVYVPNVRPNRIWRKIPGVQNFGRSDYAGVEGEMDQLDFAWTSWMRDLRLGIARIIVPQSALISDGAGQGASINIDQELLVGMNLSPSPDSDMLTQVQFNLRVQEHRDTTQSLLEQIVRDSGYSMQTFSGETDGNAQTATEVTAKEKRTLTTRDRKIAYWTLGLRDAVKMLLAVDNAQFSAGVEVDRPNVEFPDAVSDPPEVVARTIKTLEEAKAISTEVKIRMLHPDWNDDQIADEIDSIEGLNRLQQQASIVDTLGRAQALGAVDTSTTESVVRRMTNGQRQPASSAS
jgi:hypothetical protein